MEKNVAVGWKDIGKFKSIRGFFQLKFFLQDDIVGDPLGCLTFFRGAKFEEHVFRFGVHDVYRKSGAHQIQLITDTMTSNPQYLQ